MIGRWFRRTLTLLLLLAIAGGLAAWWLAQHSLPPAQGRWLVPGLQSEVRITRDAHGIPTVQAGSLNDALYGLGVVHVQDRFWQMETHRRIAAGRLAEAFGDGALPVDRYLRVLGVRQVASRLWAQAPQATRDAVNAYTAGVNAAMAQIQVLPPEFIILNITPEPWTPEDSLAWTVMMGVDLGANWQAEALRLRLSKLMDKGRIDEIMPPPGDQSVPETMDYAAFYRSLGLGTGSGHALLDQVDRLLSAVPPTGLAGVGSNSWVLSGQRTTTGSPLLANDPHLRLSTPALWYFVRLKAPGLDVGGASLPGVPGVVVGQNGRIAWGLTNTGPDVQDLYLERVNAADAAQYQTPDGWARFETRQEVIRVRGGAQETLTVRGTRHGPVISDVALSGVADGALATRGSGDYVLALRWTGLDGEGDPIGVALRMMQAGSVEQFIAAARDWMVPMQNMVVADQDGHIALVSPGKVPVRGPDNDLQGLAPAPGWEARYDWVGSLAFEDLPQVQDPASGFIANANQDITPPGYAHHITHQWALPYRHQRITQLIEAKPQHSLDDLRAIQSDVLSLGAQRLLPQLLAVQSTHPLAAAAQAQLQGFDGTMSADRAAPLIFWAWHRQLALKVLVDDLGEDLHERLIGRRGYLDALEGAMARNDGWWCNDQRTPEIETCSQQANAAFDAALDELRQLQGDNPAAWQWGKAHMARGEHRPFSRIRWLAPWFETRVPAGGDGYTVNVGRVSLKPDATTGEAYLDEHGPSLRGLYDLADRSRSSVIHSTGQSGIPWSPHFRDFLPLWQRVESVPLFPPEAADAPALVLAPGG